MEDYRVQLEFYDGPMDLLLYLVRKDEVDIGDIPIARITEQYGRYVELLRAIDINLAGEFLLMAAWLMEIKTRMLLPAQPAGAGDGPAPMGGADTPTSAADALADPRAELVRQLLAYKRFKDLADGLGDAAAAQALKYPRAGIDWEQLVGQEVEPAVDMADVQIWDLFDAFGKLMEATGRNTDHQVTYDDTPIHEHVADIVDRLTHSGQVQFERLFEGRSRGEIIGLFLAMLELIRQKRIRVQQERHFGSIVLSLRDPADVDAPSSAPTSATKPEVAGPPQSAPDSDSLAATRSSHSGERRGARRRRDENEAGPVGVTWVQPGGSPGTPGRGDPSQSQDGQGSQGGEVSEGSEGSDGSDGGDGLDLGLQAIDEELKAITIPPDPDLLASGRVAPVPEKVSRPDCPVADDQRGGPATSEAPGNSPAAGGGVEPPPGPAALAAPAAPAAQRPPIDSAAGGS